MEEAELDIKIDKLIALIENFYYRPKIKKNSHKIGFYHLCHPIFKNEEKKKDWDFIEQEGNKKTYLKFKWVKFEDLNNYDFRPTDLKEQIKNADFTFHNSIKNDLND